MATIATIWNLLYCRSDVHVNDYMGRNFEVRPSVRGDESNSSDIVADPMPAFLQAVLRMVVRLASSMDIL